MTIVKIMILAFICNAVLTKRSLMKKLFTILLMVSGSQVMAIKETMIYLK